MNFIIEKSNSIFRLMFSFAWIVYIPLRLVLWSEDVLTYDRAIDLIGLLYILVIFGSPLISKTKSKINGVTLLIGLPFFTISSYLFPDLDTSYILLIKLLSLKEVILVKKMIDDIDNLHPVIARIAPLGAIVPGLVHLIACGWIHVEDSAQVLNIQDPIFIYGRAVYWTITTLTTVGYGDISARTLAQMAYSNMVMIIGVGFFGYVLSNVATLLARLDGARESYMTNLDQVESYMSYNNIPKELRLKVREYLRYLWESRKGFDDNGALGQLPKTLQSDLAFFINHSVIEKVPILQGASQDVVREIVVELRSRVCVPKEYIFRYGEPGDAMFFIQKGEVDIVSENGQILATLGAGSFFGEMALLNSSPRNASARSVQYVDLFVLSQSAFHLTLSRYPEFKRQVQEIVLQRSA
ncbi:MAG: cyclic nucleotide-binding domain-containing protein [Bdellovibrionales bacterium]|nr:cyclic nucleotide-binding domain-containing protein [Bdellovibrionales bacterium]